MGLICNRNGVCRSYQQQLKFLTNQYEDMIDHPYTLPQATEAELGGVKAPAKGADQTEAVGIGTDGTLYTKSIPPSSSYTLPQATADELGGVKVASRSADQSELVGINPDGKLYTRYTTSIYRKWNGNQPKVYRILVISKTGLSGNLTEDEKKNFDFVGTPNATAMLFFVISTNTSYDRLYSYVTKRDISSSGPAEWEYIFASIYPKQPNTYQELDRVNVSLVIANPSAGTWVVEDINLRPSTRVYENNIPIEELKLFIISKTGTSGTLDTSELAYLNSNAKRRYVTFELKPQDANLTRIDNTIVLHYTGKCDLNNNPNITTPEWYYYFAASDLGPYSLGYGTQVFVVRINATTGAWECVQGRSGHV